MDKNKIRQIYKKIRKDILDKDIKSRLIVEKLLTLEKIKQANVIALYSPIQNEVDITKMAKIFLSNKEKQLLYPKLEDNMTMSFYKIEKLDDLMLVNQYGIKEPTENSLKRIDKQSIDVMIVPGLCFDKYKNRVGFGKGYYDRYLSDATCIYKIGVCFYEQLYEDIIDVTEYDVSMDLIVTDNCIL